MRSKRNKQKRSVYFAIEDTQGDVNDVKIRFYFVIEPSGLLGFPGGSAEPGEKGLFHDTGQRECEEETGRRLEGYKHVGYVEWGVENVWAARIYHCRLLPGAPRNFGFASEIKGGVWLTLRELHQRKVRPHILTGISLLRASTKLGKPPRKNLRKPKAAQGRNNQKVWLRSPKKYTCVSVHRRGTLYTKKRTKNEYNCIGGK